jgi:uncharacterized protein YoxC
MSITTLDDLNDVEYNPFFTYDNRLAIYYLIVSIVSLVINIYLTRQNIRLIKSIERETREYQKIIDDMDLVQEKLIIKNNKIREKMEFDLNNYTDAISNLSDEYDKINQENQQLKDKVHHLEVKLKISRKATELFNLDSTLSNKRRKVEGYSLRSNETLENPDIYYDEDSSIGT